MMDPLNLPFWPFLLAGLVLAGVVLLLFQSCCG